MNEQKELDAVDVEIESLNMQDLAVEALEHRVEMAALAQTADAAICIIDF
ncbi:hypothetical protein [Polyangium sp. 6x1]|nr:hypothetical protein [Polyangium sp. 6x1]MDI1451085.1 hypothetical protein [Polyangium sp. 6x1]